MSCPKTNGSGNGCHTLTYIWVYTVMKVTISIGLSGLSCLCSGPPIHVLGIVPFNEAFCTQYSKKLSTPDFDAFLQYFMSRDWQWDFTSLKAKWNPFANLHEWNIGKIHHKRRFLLIFHDKVTVTETKRCEFWLEIICCCTGLVRCLWSTGICTLHHTYSSVESPHGPCLLVRMLTTLSRNFDAMTWSRRRADVIKWSQSFSSSRLSTIVCAPRDYNIQAKDEFTTVYNVFS